MKRKILAVVAVLAIALGFNLFMDTTPAFATWWGCPGGTGCVYTGYNGTGSNVTLSVGQYGIGVCHNFNSPFVNSISSVTETYGSDLDIVLYPEPNCHDNAGGGTGIFVSGECAYGNYLCPYNDDGSYNFNTTSGLKFDNRMDSFRIENWCNC